MSFPVLVPRERSVTTPGAPQSTEVCILYEDLDALGCQGVLRKMIFVMVRIATLHDSDTMEVWN